jgi:dTDP-4-amino-4,6-dideoxygalactose transaminase
MIEAGRERLEAVVCSHTGRKHCVLVGRGTTAIYLALRAIERRAGTGEVILPTICCASIAQMVLYAGFTPVFADVELDSLTLDVESFRARLTSSTRAVLPIHIFGYAARMTEISATAGEHGIAVIEDAAQSVGGVCDGRPMGSHGEMSVLSFGGAKVLEAGGGGALVTDDAELAGSIAEDAGNLPPFARTATYGLTSLSHRNLYHALVDLVRADGNTRVGAIFRDALPLYEDLYVQAFPDSPAISTAIATGFEHLAENAKARVERGLRYAELLTASDVSVPSRWAESSVLWRFSFLVNDSNKTVDLTAALRAQNVHASNHYWSLADLLYDDKSHPNTSWACSRIVNLWVDATATREYIDRSCAVIKQALL